MRRTQRTWCASRRGGKSEPELCWLLFQRRSRRERLCVYSAQGVVGRRVWQGKSVRAYRATRLDKRRGLQGLDHRGAHVYLQSERVDIQSHHRVPRPRV